MRLRRHLILVGCAAVAAAVAVSAWAQSATSAARDGHVAYKARKYAEAASYFELAVAYDGTNHEYYYWASMSHSGAMEDDDAYEWILGALSLAPDNPDYLAQKGRVCLFLGNPGEAAMAYEKAIEANPQDGAMWAAYGTVLKNSGRPYQAMEAFQKAVAIDASLPGVAQELGLVLLDLKDPEQAVGALRKSVAADPRCADCQLELGDALMATGEPRQALSAYAEALRLVPDDYRPHARSIRACYALADYKTAEAHRRKLQAMYDKDQVHGIGNVKGYKIDEFSVGDLTVQAWAYFDGEAPEDRLWTFLAYDPTGFQERELAAVTSGRAPDGSGKRNDNSGPVALRLIEQTPEGQQAERTSWTATPTYATVRTAVLQALSTR